LYAVEIDALKKNRSGNDFVFMFTLPPENAPGWSAVNDF